MSCRKVSRELLERFRFGEELDARSAPHLAHLAGCPTCREELGLDRALVRELQRALRTRVVGHEPSPRAFNAVRIRALATEEESINWGARLYRVLRLAPAGAAMAIMLVAVVNATSGEPRGALPERPFTWPGVMERVDNGPLTPKEEAWWRQHQPAPAITRPASGVIASIDPSPLGKELPLPKPSTGLIE
jgi:hypothetical protein